MNQRIKTSLAYTKNLLVTGSITPSSRNVEIEICKYVPKEGGRIIVEFGMGHGSITREILNNMAPDSKLYSFEINGKFCEHVRTNISDERLIVINDTALNVKNHINEEVHLVVGSIPLSFFSKEKRLELIQNTYDILVDNAHFSQVLYSRYYFKCFNEIFEECYTKVTKNTPKAHIHHSKKIKKID
jgi:phospholipid N-methyltransferase